MGLVEKVGLPLAEAGRRLGVSTAAISKIKMRDTYHHNPDYRLFALPFPFGYRHLLKAEMKPNRNRY